MLVLRWRARQLKEMEQKLELKLELESLGCQLVAEKFVDLPRELARAEKRHQPVVALLEQINWRDRLKWLGLRRKRSLPVA